MSVNGGSGGTKSLDGKSRGWRRFATWALIVPYIGTLWVATYASITPTIWGIPFFYWYQLLWIAIGAAITITVYLADTSGETPRDGYGR